MDSDLRDEFASSRRRFSIFSQSAAQNGGRFCPSSRQDRQSGGPRARLDLGGRSRGAGTALQIEHTLKLKMARMQTDTPAAGPARRMIQNPLASRTLTALPGEVFV